MTGRVSQQAGMYYSMGAKICIKNPDSHHSSLIAKGFQSDAVEREWRDRMVETVIWSQRNPWMVWGKHAGNKNRCPCLDREWAANSNRAWYLGTSGSAAHHITLGMFSDSIGPGVYSRTSYWQFGTVNGWIERMPSEPESRTKPPSEYPQTRTLCYKVCTWPKSARSSVLLVF